MIILFGKNMWRTVLLLVAAVFVGCGRADVVIQGDVAFLNESGSVVAFTFVYPGDPVTGKLLPKQMFITDRKTERRVAVAYRVELEGAVTEFTRAQIEKELRRADSRFLAIVAAKDGVSLRAYPAR